MHLAYSKLIVVSMTQHCLRNMPIYKLIQSFLLLICFCFDLLKYVKINDNTFIYSKGINSGLYHAATKTFLALVIYKVEQTNSEYSTCHSEGG